MPFIVSINLSHLYASWQKINRSRKDGLVKNALFRYYLFQLLFAPISFFNYAKVETSIPKMPFFFAISCGLSTKD